MHVSLLTALDLGQSQATSTAHTSVSMTVHPLVLIKPKGKHGFGVLLSH